MEHQEEQYSPLVPQPTAKENPRQLPHSAPSPSAQEKTNLNPIFDLLAGDSNDIEGLAAYALYKRHKRAWAQSIRESGSEPEIKDDLAFSRFAATSDQLERYRKDAQDILISFANAFVSDERPEIIQEALTGRAEAAFAKIEGSGSFLSLVKVGVVSTIITTVILAAIAYSVQTFGLDLLDALSALVGEPTG